MKYDEFLNFFKFIEKDGYINSRKFTHVAFFVAGLAITLALTVPKELVLSIFICFMVLVLALVEYMYWYFSQK
jgi:uncharacterized membrane protein